MKPVKRTFLPWLGAFLLAGCGVQLEVAEEAEPKGTDFSKSLYEGYLELSRAEYQEGDYKDSDTFAERAITAADGAAPQPEPIEARKLPADQASFLADARDRLLALLQEGGIERLPQEAAAAQIKFECWMQEQEENRQPEDIAACRTDFFDAMAYLETELAPRSVAAAETPKPQATAKIEAVPAPAPAALEPIPDTFVVYFDFDQSKLSQDSISVLMEVVLAASKKRWQRDQRLRPHRFRRPAGLQPGTGSKARGCGDQVPGRKRRRQGAHHDRGSGSCETRRGHAERQARAEKPAGRDQVQTPRAGGQRELTGRPADRQ